MRQLAEIKDNFQTCIEEELNYLKQCIKEFLGLDDNLVISVMAWPYTQAMQVTWDGGSDWVGVCRKDSTLAKGKKCPCGNCTWIMGLGGVDGNIPSGIYIG